MRTPGHDHAEPIFSLARRWFILYGLALFAGGAADLARRGFAFGELHGIRLAIGFIVGGSLIGALHRFGPRARIGIDIGLLLTIAVTANYGRLALKTAGLPEPDVARIALFGVLAAVGAVCALRIGWQRLALRARPARTTVRTALTRGACGLTGAAMIATGLFVSHDVRLPHHAVAEMIETTRLAANLEGPIREVLDHPDRLARLLANPDVQRFATGIAEGEETGTSGAMRTLARAIADADPAALRAAVDSELSSVIGVGARSRREVSTPAASDAAHPAVEDSIAPAVAALRARAARLTPAQRARLSDLDPRDPDVRSALAEHGVDDRIVVQLMEEMAPARAPSSETPGGTATFLPAVGPPRRLELAKPAQRVQHIVRPSRAASTHATRRPTGTRGIDGRLPARPATPDSTHKAGEAVESVTGLEVEPDAADAGEETRTDARVAPTSRDVTAPHDVADRRYRIDVPAIISMLKAATPPPPPPPDPDPPNASARRWDQLGGMTLLILGLLVVGLSLRPPKVA